MQAENRRALEEQRKWNEAQALLGKDNPYKNPSSLRKALRSEKDSFEYKASHNLKDDYQQYKEWQKIVGKENMPESLAEFQGLKYNNSSEFEALKREYRTISEIKQKEWTTSFKEKTIAEYYLYKEQGIEFSSHGIARCVQRGIKRETILDVGKKIFNYVQPDGRYIKHYSGITLIYSEDKTTIVSVVITNKVKEEWNEYN